MNQHETIQHLRVQAYSQANEEAYLFTSRGELVHHFLGDRSSVRLPSYYSYSGLDLFHNHPMRFNKEVGVSLFDMEAAITHRLRSIHAVTANHITSFFVNDRAKLYLSTLWFLTGGGIDLSKVKTLDRECIRYRDLITRVPGVFDTWITDPMPEGSIKQYQQHWLDEYAEWFASQYDYESVLKRKFAQLLTKSAY